MEELYLLENSQIFQTNQAISTLVGDCPILQAHLKKYPRDSDYMFCTISPNPMTRHQVTKVVKRKRVTVSMPYGMLPQRVQYDYCMRILSRCYTEFLSKGSIVFGTWELNEQKNVHFHFIIHDPKIRNTTHIAIFQRDVANCTEVIANMSKKNKNARDYMNNICFVNDSLHKRIKYMDKDFELNSDIFNNYYKIL